MDQPVMIWVKPKKGGRVEARAKRLKGFTRKKGPIKQVFDELKASLRSTEPGRQANKIHVRIFVSKSEVGMQVGANFYSALGEIVTSGHNYQILSLDTIRNRAVKPTTEPSFRSRLEADWPRNAAIAPLILVVGGIGGGLAAAAGLASFWLIAPITAFAALLLLSLVYTAAAPHL